LDRIKIFTNYTNFVINGHIIIVLLGKINEPGNYVISIKYKNIVLNTHMLTPNIKYVLII